MQQRDNFVNFQLCEFPMGDMRVSFQRNLNAFEPLRAKYADPICLCETMAHFFFSSGTRAAIHASIRSGEIPNPRHALARAVDGESFRALYDDTKGCFVVREPVDNPPLLVLRPGKGSAVQYIDLGGCFLSSVDPVRRLGRFGKLAVLSLRNCGLLSVAPELAAPPKSLHFLDLSSNYIAVLPAKLAWGQLRGLNLSHNALAAWPEALTPGAAPHLAWLSIAGNQVACADGAAFKHLRSIDCSDTQLAGAPAWLSACAGLRIVRLAGATRCAQLPLAYLAHFEHLKVADLTGVGRAGACGGAGAELRLLVAVGADRAACPAGNYTLLT
jgi:hypothetical protein